jgi:hypothetical protein
VKRQRRSILILQIRKLVDLLSIKIRTWIKIIVESLGRLCLVVVCDADTILLVPHFGTRTKVADVARHVSFHDPRFPETAFFYYEHLIFMLKQDKDLIT